MKHARLVAIALVSAITGACSDSTTSPALAQEASPAAADSKAIVRGGEPLAVSGTGIHYFTTAMIHSQEPTPTGMIQRSTDVVELRGDIEGYVLYHPTSVFDFAAGTLVNTGSQLFSGTILGSEPVILHDDRYRVAVQLQPGGATEGRVYLGRSKDAPHRGSWYECDLILEGDGETTAAGDAIVSYEGTCQRYGR